MSLFELQLEALLVASAKPVDLTALEAIASKEEISLALRSLQSFWRGRGLELQLHDGRVMFEPAKTCVKTLSQVGEAKRRLSEASVETLCFIALNQPVTIKEIEAARGVKLFKGVVDALMDAGFVRASMRKTDSGRALAYVTTDLLLEYYGLSSVADFPTADELEEMRLEIISDGE